MRYSQALTLCGLAVGCGSPEPLDYPREAAAILTKYIAAYATLPAAVTDAGYHVYDLGQASVFSFVPAVACYEPAGYLTQACREISAGGLAPPGCSGAVASYGDPSSPACAIRLTVPAAQPEQPPLVLAADLLTCSAGQTCQSLPFSGCETVIQRHFQAAGLATVNAASWSSPRTHVMQHAPVAALRPLDPALCDEAQLAASRVCDELLATMAFVGACRSEVRYLTAPRPACAVRFTVHFTQTNRENSVLTTQLDGLLSFRIE